MLKLKTCTLLEILDPVIAMMPKRVQHFSKLQAMGLPTAQELITLISTGQAKDVGSFHHATESSRT
jgi:hypothetical protein